jgi:hypothetical protein
MLNVRCRQVSYITETTIVCCRPEASRIFQSTLSYTRLNICWCRGAVADIERNLIFPSPSFFLSKQTVRPAGLGNNQSCCTLPSYMENLQDFLPVIHWDTHALHDRLQGLPLRSWSQLFRVLLVPCKGQIDCPLLQIHCNDLTFL